MVLLFLAGAGAGGQAPRDDNPLPMYRKVVSPEQLLDELARLKQGALVKLPRDEFEARVRKATAANAQLKAAARVVRAHYQAELLDQSLVQGRGEWAVHNPGIGAAPLPLAPLNLALSHAAWEDGRPAIIGDFDSKGLAEWVEGTGLASLFFDWTSRGAQTPQGLIFDLRLPACPQTTLELRLPTDSWPAIPARTGLLTGPHDAGTPGRRLWKLQVAGKTQVELTIRKVPAAPVPLFVQSHAQQTITPDRVAADYEFQVEAPHGAVRALTFDGDAALEPYEVTARSADLTWRWDAPNTLRVEFREPQQGRIAGLRVRCLAARPAPAALWTSPGLRLRQAVCRAETLQLQFHHDVHLGRWFGGDFHTTATATEADGTLTLGLVNVRATMNAPPTPQTRPRCQLATNTAEFAAIQHSRWHIESGLSVLNSEIAYAVSSGELHQLAVKLPAVQGPYRVESVDVEPKGRLRGWTPAGPLLIVELDHAVTPRTEARLRVRLSAPVKSKATVFTLDMPDVTPQGTAVRDGTFTITLDPLYHAQLLQSSVAPVAPPTANPPAYTFTYHDQPVTGKLRLFTRRPRLHVNTRQEAVLGPAAGRWSADIQIEPLLGRPSFVDIYLSAPLHEPWDLTADGAPTPIDRLERLPVQEALPGLLRLGATSPLAPAALHLGLPRGELWRVHFAAPLVQTTRLRMRGVVHPPLVPLLSDHLPLLMAGASPWHALSAISVAALHESGAGTRWEVPVLCVPSADQQDGQVIVNGAGQRIARADGAGIAPLAAPTDSTSLTYRLALSGDAWPQLRVMTHRQPTTAAAGAVCEASELTSCLEADGTLSHLLRVRLRNWQEPRFAIVVPAAVEGLAAKVDGIWVDRLEAESIPQGTRFVLPVNTAAPIVQLELLYASTVPDGALLAHVLHAPAPRLPQEPLAARRFWRAPAGWVPLDRDRWRQRGEPEAVRALHALASLPDRFWHAGESLLPDGTADDSALEALRDDLRTAEVQVRAKLGAAATLGEALDRLAAAMPAGIPLVVDVEGLRAAGREPATLLPANRAASPLWQAADLVPIPCPSGVLLTTGRRARQWQEQTGHADLATLLDPAVVQAALYGLDHAGAFASVAHWLRMASSPIPGHASRDIGQTFAMFAPAPAAGWVEWEPVPGLVPEPTLVLVHEPTAQRLGLLLAIAWLLFAAWLSWRLGPAAFFRVHLAVTTALLLAVLWLPGPLRELFAWPLLLTEVLVFGAALTLRTWPGRGTPRLSKSTMVRTTSAVALLAAATAALPLLAQGPAASERPVVLLVRVPRGDEPGQEFALAPPDLLRKLDEIASQQPALPTGAVVLAAQYHGKLHEGMAEFEAHFELHHFAPQSTLVLPLTGVQLQPGVFLDGAPVFPVAHKGGYALPLRGKGAHKLTLRFRVRPALVSDLHEVRFGMPRAGQCELELTSSVPARGLHLVGGLGATRAPLDKRGLATLEAQLGHENLVQLRWAATVKPAQATAVEVREAYSWDLRPQSLALTAGVQFTITKGSVAQLRFAMPDGLDVRQVELAGRPSTPPVLPAPALRQWQITGVGAARQLVIDLAQPITGTLTLRIDMVPRLALTAGEWTLKLPAPLNATSTAGILGYRTDAVDSVAGSPNLSIGIVPPELLKEPWAEIALRDPPAAIKLVKFSRIARFAALRLNVRPAPTAQLDLKWHVAPRHAELAARINLTSAAEDLVLVELELPPRFKLVRLGEVAGNHLHHWTRQDRLVQLWLQQPCKQLQLAVHGWVEHAKAGPAATFELAPLRVLQTRSTASTIEVEPQPGLALTPARLFQVTRTDKSDGLHLHTDAGNYAATFALRAVDVAATGRAFTLLERHGDTVEMATALHLHPRPGEVRIALSGWHGSDLRLESPAPVVRKGHKQKGADHVWTVQVPPGLPQTITFTVRGRFTAGQPAETWKLPGIKLDRIALTDHWIGLAGIEVANAQDIPLRPAGHAPGAAPPYPPAPRALTARDQVAKLAAGAASLAVRFPPPAPSAQVLFAQHEVFWAGARWVHRLRLLAFTAGQGELRVRLPDGGRCRAIMVNDKLTTPTGDNLAIPLAGTPGPRAMDICWTYDESERTDAPRLDCPTVQGVPAAAIHSCLWLPAAYAPMQMPDGQDSATADLLLRQAEARMQMCRLWSQSRPPVEDLGRLQQAVQRDIARAQSLIAQLQRLGAAGSADLASRAQTLTRDNARLAAEGKVRTPPVAYGSTPPRHGLILGEIGLPCHWRTSGALALAPTTQHDEAIARSGIELTLVIAVALLLISRVRRGLALIHLFWPETLAALTAFGIVLGGWTPLALSVLLLWATLRLVWIVVIARRVVPAWFTTPADPTHGDNGPISASPVT